MVLNYKQIGQRIRVIRKVQKLTQAEVAERTGLSVPYISHIENGVKQASLQAVVNIAEALGCTADDIVYENQPERHGIWPPELADLLSGCTGQEQQFLLGVLSAMKDYIINNRHIFGSTVNR